MGGKNGKIAATNGNDLATHGKVGGKNGKIWAERRPHPGRDARGCFQVKPSGLPRYAVVQVRVGRDGPRE
jgi:hypothetical protein